VKGYAKGYKNLHDKKENKESQLLLDVVSKDGNSGGV